MKEIGTYVASLVFPEQDEEAKEILSPLVAKQSQELTENELEKKKSLE